MTKPLPPKTQTVMQVGRFRVEIGYLLPAAGRKRPFARVSEGKRSSKYLTGVAARLFHEIQRRHAKGV